MPGSSEVERLAEFRCCGPRRSARCAGEGAFGGLGVSGPCEAVQVGADLADVAAHNEHRRSEVLERVVATLTEVFVSEIGDSACLEEAVLMLDGCTEPVPLCFAPGLMEALIDGKDDESHGSTEEVQR